MPESTFYPWPSQFLEQIHSLFTYASIMWVSVTCRQNPDKYKSDLAGTGSVLYERMGHICLVTAIPLGSSLIIIW